MVLLEPNHVHLFTHFPGHTYYDAELSNCDRLFGWQSLKYLLSDPLQKNFAYPCSRSKKIWGRVHAFLDLNLPG